MNYLPPEQFHTVWLHLPEAQRAAFVHSFASEARAVHIERLDAQLATTSGADHD